jgi:catechol 2,3-dioxygenase-like lactoylglutathione lyase family enzyme
MREVLRLTTAYPQLYVADVTKAVAFYRDVLAFDLVYLWDVPPLGLVRRDGAGLNLRQVERPVIDPALRERDNLLSAIILVETLTKLYFEYKERGVTFHRTLIAHPWGPAEFIVRDPDGNLISFNGDVGPDL